MSRIIVEKFNDLPKDCIEKLESLNMTEDDVSLHFDTIVNIFYFKTEYHIYTKSTKKKRDESKLPSRHEVHSLVSDKLISIGTLEEEERELVDSDIGEGNYELKEKIGSGGFGKVYRARSEVEGGSRVAVKITSHGTDKEKRKNFQELRFLMYCQGERNILKLLRAHVFGDKMWIVTEFVNGGNLSEIIDVHDFNEPEIVYIAKSILKALNFLHDIHLVHRDIKPANIMIDKSGTVKLVDFGLCGDISHGPVVHMVGSPFWLPPEMINRDPHGLPADIWSFGIVLMELAAEELFKSSVEQLFVGVTKGYPEALNDKEKWSDLFRDFLQKTLSRDPSERWTAKQLLEHPFITDNDRIYRADMKKKMVKIREDL